MATRFQLTFDCADPDAQAHFWAEALGYRLPDPPPGFATWDAFAEAHGVPPENRNDRSACEDPAGEGPRIFFQKVPEGKVAKNRMHLDLTVGGPRGTELEERKRRVRAERDRLVALGASDHRGEKDEMGEYWIRMNDPEGNEFCLQ
jgi:hypothetical protein